METCERCGHERPAGEDGCPACGFNSRVAAQDTGAIDLTGGPDTGVTREDLPSDVSAVVVVKGPSAGERFLLLGESGSTVSVGRSADTDIFLDDVTVSRHHGVFTRENHGWHFADNGSMNGTYLNGVRIESAALSDGDLLIIGRFTFLFTGPQQRENIHDNTKSVQDRS